MVLYYIQTWVVRMGHAAYAVISLALLVLTLLGMDDPAPLRLIAPLAGGLFIPRVLMIVGGFAHDIQRRDALNGTG